MSAPSFLVHTEAEKATYETGFRLKQSVEDGWLRFASAQVPGRVWVAAAEVAGPWFLALDHPGAVAEFGPAAALPGPGLARYLCGRLSGLHAALDRAWRLLAALPPVPLDEFHARTAGLPRHTEAERLVVQRVGQDVFRRALLSYWGGRCPLTGITDLRLLRASHIVSWAECGSDAERLDVHNGLLLSALWDSAFDAGLVGFADDGTVRAAPALSPAAALALGIASAPALAPLTLQHRANLARHRERHGLG